MRSIGWFVLGLCFAASSCEKGDTLPQPEPELLSLKSAELVQQTENFGWSLLLALNEAAAPEENVVLSPLSVAQAMGMALNGASGDNLLQMCRVLGYDDPRALNEAFRNVRRALESADPKVTMGVVNSAWYRKGFELNSDFLACIADYYAARAEGLDFGNEEAAKAVINKWVKDATRDRIPSIVDKIRPEHVLFLVNAVYFKGEWSARFDAKKTVEAPFYTASGGVNVPMMQQEGPFQYYSGADFEAVRLAYGDSAFSMHVVLPREGSSADDLLAQMKEELWARLQEDPAPSQLQLALPRFKTEASYDLIPALEKLGMQLAFQDDTGFGHLANDRMLISDVKHKTFLEVDERGSEAAAVTSVGFSVTSIPQLRSFRVDRPFVFVISEKASGAVLFAGKIAHPLK